MAKRSKLQQSKHDALIKRIAAGYKAQGWKVKADILGYPKPLLIYGKRPDVVAEKRKQVRIIEVETPDTYKKDVAQRKAFERYASLNKNRKFKVRIAK